ncbi:hypothetical protein F3P66_13785 [Agrobacterium fabrum]|uniref:Uncharacterized protein n=1 Tax=Agrobacterium fabrum (strain C58 / ATCC 33970) TaxID=176299 RepID=Q8UIZ7_AGRFC|nr:hypothetical protein Atu0144 [Agrobacterium fabrum str. C58]QRM60393.1 hypothetical protein F3P66_13785 [Agrobacterium fabrum]TRB31846.1 hypothetical protein EXN51_06940 [Agrobacterium fabrum]
MFFYCVTAILILTRHIMKYYVSNTDIIQCVLLPECRSPGNAMRTTTIIICEKAAIAATPLDGRKTTVRAIKRR